MEPINANLKDWLEKLKSDDAEARAVAARAAGPQGAAAIVPLAEIMGGDNKGAAWAATQALNHIAHYSARPGARPQEARQVAAELLKIAASNRPRMVRSEALDALGFIGGAPEVPMLARLLDDKDVREEARMALERIPGAESQRALQQASQKAPADFQPNLRQSLYSRSLTAATAGTQIMK